MGVLRLFVVPPDRLWSTTLDLLAPSKAPARIEPRLLLTTSRVVGTTMVRDVAARSAEIGTGIAGIHSLTFPDLARELAGSQSDRLA
ncbi:MAG: hypothetical protein JSV80_13880, partial [Acidobacteriota bacterium]